MQFEHKLKHSRVSSGGDGPKSRRAEVSVGIAQRWRIGDVKGLRTKLHPKTFRQREGFPYHHISYFITGSANRITGTVPNSKLRGWSKSSDIEIASCGALSWWEVRI